MSGMIFVVAAVALLSPESAPHNATEQILVEGDVRMVVTWSRPVIEVADDIELEVRVEAPAETGVTLPKLPDQVGGLVVVVQREPGKVPLATESSRAVWIWKATLQSVRAGEFLIPALAVELEMRGPLAESTSSPATLRSQPIEVSVASVLTGNEDPTEFRDLKPLQSVVSETAGRSRTGAIAATVLILGLLGIAAARWRRYQQQRIDSAWAWSEVDRLQRDQVVESREVCGELSAIVRQVISEQVQIDMSAETTDHWVDFLRGEYGSESFVERVEQLFAMADQEKFAGSTVTVRDSAETAFQLTRSILADCQLLSPKATGVDR